MEKTLSQSGERLPEYSDFARPCFFISSSFFNPKIFSLWESLKDYHTILPHAAQMEERSTGEWMAQVLRQSWIWILTLVPTAYSCYFLIC